MKLLVVTLLLAISYAQTVCQNDFTKQECNQIKKFGKCAHYYDQCEKKCGCFQDQQDYENLRIEAGIDDSAVLTGNNCLTNYDTTFTDKNGFGCRVYEGAGWCNGDDYGERWCGWFPKSEWRDDDSNHWCKIKKGRWRMTTFEDYSPVFEEPDARSCCCDGDLFEDYKADYETGFEDPATTCEDYKVDGEPWHDDQGWSCAVYHYGDLCKSDGQRSDGWKNAEWGTLQSHKFGKWHAKDACCVCGGGHRTQHWEILPAVNVRRIHKFAKKNFSDIGAKGVNRANRHLRKLWELTQEDTTSFHPEHVEIVEECLESVDGKPNQESTWNNFLTCWGKLKDVLLATDAQAYNYLTK